MAYDVTTPLGQVRLLINDITADPVFADTDVAAFLAMEGGNVKRAAAQALDTIADDEALTSKAIRTQDLATDGPKVAESLRKRATALRAQADAADDDSEAGFFFGVIDLDPAPERPERTQYPYVGF